MYSHQYRLAAGDSPRPRPGAHMVPSRFKGTLLGGMPGKRTYTPTYRQLRRSLW